eukprot:ANDGO_06199.mRNA.1 putative tRNA(His) guanylyltransferase
MANSRYEYVRKFESDDTLLPGCWLVVRLDGKAFSKFSQDHAFSKPVDLRGINLMNSCAEAVMREFGDIVLSYGHSDEFSFVFAKDAQVFKRRAQKICTTISSLFAAHYVFQWYKYFPDMEMRYPPSFDARAVLYPADNILRDYLSWRQVDCHINNLYNTAFWTLVHRGGCTPDEASKELDGTLSDYKNELLFTRFNINYNDLPAVFRKGSILVKKVVEETIERTPGVFVQKRKRGFVVLYEDLIRDPFWADHPEILGELASQPLDGNRGVQGSPTRKHSIVSNPNPSSPTRQAVTM